MYPIVTGVAIPAAWSKFTHIAPHTYGDKLNFDANRKSWLAKWSAIFG
jgi:ABC-type thiamine transport system substrate-binding protein